MPSQLIVQKDPRSPASESYRTLRTNIEFSSLDKKLNSVVITSSGPGEGKSTTISNLALAVANAGKKVLLVDCDLRKPSLHRKFGVSNQKGLSNILIDQVKFEDAVINYSHKFDLITSGTIPPNPSEMLSSKKMKSFIKEMEEKYDVLFLDAPPILAVTDAAVLSTMVSGTILVICSGDTEIEASKKAVELLKNVKANILGVVLNKFEKLTSNSYRYKYYYYYGHDGKKEKRKAKR